MNHIGKIVQAYRLRRNMSRSSLASGICSEKHLYLIEKNDRSPSPEILRLLSNRLGVNLFQYYEYLGGKNPILLCEMMTQCARLRRAGDFPRLRELTERMIQMSDFTKKPWRYEVVTNDFCIRLFQDLDAQNVVADIENCLKEMEPEYAEEEFTAGLYGMLSTGYQMLYDMEKAQQAYLLADHILQSKKENSRYHQINVSVALTGVSLNIYNKKYGEAIRSGLDLIEYQEHTSSYERLNITYFFLACAYYQFGESEIGVDWLDKSIYNLLTFHRPAMAYHVYNNPLYHEMIKSAKNRQIVELFHSRYGFV